MLVKVGISNHQSVCVFVRTHAHAHLSVYVSPTNNFEPLGGFS
jgi:hypothetical protein